MANIDTGLGWYADEDWLANQAGETIATLSGGGGGGGNGYLDQPYFSKVSSGGVVTVTLDDGRIVDIKNNSPSDMYYCVYYYDSSTKGVLGVFYENSDGAAAARVNSGVYTSLYMNTRPVVGAYSTIKSHSFSFAIYYIVSAPIQIFDPVSEWGVSPRNANDLLNYMADHFSFTSSGPGHVYNKSTAGYSVTCMCKWKSESEGPVYVSPVLISSEPNNTLFTRDSASPSVDNTEHQYQGMTFYMRKAPLDTFTEGAVLTSAFPVVDLSDGVQSNSTIFFGIVFRSNLTVGQTDPYSGAGESEPGAENATFDFDSTAIDFGTPPTVTAAGMVELYIPSTSDLASLAQYLWAGSFDPENFKKLFADPMDAIIGLQIVPVTAAQIGTTPDTLYVGNVSTGLSMPKATRQYVPVDCGSLSIPRRLGSYLDYSPHTEMQLYLPYVGFVDISPDDCMGGTVSVKYMVDIIGGTCVAQVKCNSHVLYEFAAACSCQVPVSAGQYQNIVLGAVRGAIGLTSGVLGAAGGGLFSGLSEAADAALSMTKPKIQRSGGFGGSSGLMGHQTPYIIYTVPRLIVPGRQNNFIGYPSYITRTLGDLTGYTQIDSIHLSGIPASQSEQAEIEQLLQEGVYL